MAKKMWAGRFEKATDKAVNDFNSSLPFDCRMYKQDIEGSVAHSQMLAKQDFFPFWMISIPASSPLIRMPKISICLLRKN